METKVFRGLVVKATGSWYNVRVENIQEIFQCRIRGNFRLQGIKATNPVTVGDWVKFQLLAEENAGVITEIEDRRNYIIRKSVNLSKRTHVLAANIDQAVLVISLSNPRTSTGFIDRFLVNAESYHIKTLLVFNKMDLFEGTIKKQYDEIRSIYEKIGYSCIAVSALEGTNCNELKMLLQNKVNMLVGHSGAGKSALINQIDPSLNLKTGSISNWSGKGTHTTTFSEIFPLSFGGDIIDTPGIKEFGMVDLQKEEISRYFPEMFRFLHDCRFNNCTHEHEPACAVKKALEHGEISEIRYQNYLNILHGEEMDTEEWENR